MPIFQNQEIWSDLANMSVDLWVFKRCPIYLGINQMAVGWPPLPLSQPGILGHILGPILSFPDKGKFIFPPYLAKAQFDGALFTKGPSLTSMGLLTYNWKEGIQVQQRWRFGTYRAINLLRLECCLLSKTNDKEAKETTPHSSVPLQLTRRPQSSTGVSEGFPRAVILRAFALIIQFIVI